MRESDIDTV